MPDFAHLYLPAWKQEDHRQHVSQPAPTELRPHVGPCSDCLQRGLGPADHSQLTAVPGAPLPLYAAPPPANVSLVHTAAAVSVLIVNLFLYITVTSTNEI